ncbi:hypothetical protein P5673_016399, partial [Acropora cervicornis]
GARGAPNFASEGFSTSSPRCNAPNGVACIRDNLQVRGISPRAASFLLKSWRPGTEKQYSAAWRCFCCWYDEKQRNPLQANLRTVCDFLTEQFEDFDKSYTTIILTDLHCPLCYYLDILLYPIIARLLKEMFHFPLWVLGLKTAALAALVSAQRSQTLSALSIEFINSNATDVPENEKLCAHSTLLHYVARTASIRQSLNSSQVFVSY